LKQKGPTDHNVFADDLSPNETGFHMATIAKFDPPGFLKDFDSITGQRDGWSQYISKFFDSSIADVETEVGSGKCQFFNQTKSSPATLIERNVVWNAFPRTLVQRHGKAMALKMADELENFTDGPFGPTLSRPQDEYCEWRVTWDAATQKITRVTFTCEGPEYWQSIAGGPSVYANPGQAPMDFGASGDPDVLLQLYRDLLGTNSVQKNELFVTAGGQKFYNPWNDWNTSKGIIHLQQINNTLGAEIHIGADATVLRKKGGLPVNDATRLICCSGYGGPERSSDPSLGFEVNKLAAEARKLTLRNPVGIYMDQLDTAGWTIPNPVAGGPRLPVGDWWRIIRGVPDSPGQPSSGMAVRAVYEVPLGIVDSQGKQVTVGDIEIGGVAITQGGHIAEKITMKFVALAGPTNELVNPRFDCLRKCCKASGVLQVRSLTSTCQDVFPVSPAPSAVAVVSAGDVKRISASRRHRSE
jgi:hypothetical protein